MVHALCLREATPAHPYAGPLTQEPLRSHVWLPRAEHHVTLLVDGLCKFRCLFKDYDPSFSVKEEDYALTKRILTRIVASWSADLSPRGAKNGS